MKIYLNLFTRKANSGFTLIELILASIGMFFVVMAAGYGVFVMTRENVAANAASETQYNLGRAVDFISEEVKTASLIRDDVSFSNLELNAPNFADLSQTGKTVILAIRVPGLSEDIIYYTQQNPGDPWLGNLAIYRWGPGLDSNGAYTGTWGVHLLVDLIADAPLTPITDTTPAVPESDKNTGCANNSAVINNANATTGWTQIPSSNQKGFYVCIDNTTWNPSSNASPSTTPNQRKSVEIHASASALNTQKTTGLKSATGTNSRFYDKATYEIITQAYTRAN